MYPHQRSNVFVKHSKDERSLLRIQQSLLLPWKVLIRAAVLVVYHLNCECFRIALPPCCLQSFPQLPDFTPFLNSLSYPTVLIERSLSVSSPIMSGVMPALASWALTWALGSGGWLDCSRRWQSSSHPWTYGSKSSKSRWEMVRDCWQRVWKTKRKAEL